VPVPGGGPASESHHHLRRSTMPRKSRRPNAAKPALPEQLRRNTSFRAAAKPSFNRPAARKAPPTRRSGGHRG
jgi:hypothetical protein